jgi:hypothetical protein
MIPGPASETPACGTIPRMEVPSMIVGDTLPWWEDFFCPVINEGPVRKEW